MARYRLAPAAILVVALALAGPLLAGCGSDSGAAEDRPSADFPSLEAPDFARQMSRPGTTLVDVSSRREFEDAHIEGARNIAVEEQGFEERIEALDPDGTYALYCRDDRRSGKAMRVMAEHGLTRVYDLDGGMQAWMAYGGAVTRN